MADKIAESKFQSTLPVWGATPLTHQASLLFWHFNPRSPCGERPALRKIPAGHRIFQSTLPVWGATRHPGRWCRWRGYFNPRSPCGERPINQFRIAYAYQISIHAPRVGSDTSEIVLYIFEEKFQSTLPVWGATRQQPPAVWPR